jgi:hypothetical protein
MPLDHLFPVPTKTTLAGRCTLGRCVLFTTFTDLFISLLSWVASIRRTVQLCDESLKKVGSSGIWCLKVQMMIGSYQQRAKRIRDSSPGLFTRQTSNFRKAKL